MTRSKPARLRMSLFASSSLVGSSLAAGFAGLAVVAAPGVASATCTPGASSAAVAPSAGPPVIVAKAATTVINCTSVPPSTADAGVAASTGATNLTVNFNSEVVTTTGVVLDDAGQTAANGQVYGPANITLTAAGTNSITNTAGAGLSIATTFTAPAVAASAGPPVVTAQPAVASGSITATTAGNVTGTTNAVNLSTVNSAITYTAAAGTLSGAGTAAAPVVLATSTSGAVTLNFGATATPASTATVLTATPVVIGSSSTGTAIKVATSGAATVNIGAQNKSGINAGVTGVTALTGVATLNGHVDFSGVTGATTINLLGEQQTTNQYAQSVWNLGSGTTTFGPGLSDIENRGIINIGQTQANSAANPTIVPNTVAIIDFGGLDATAVADAKTKVPLLPTSSGGANSDRFTNQAGTASAASQVQYTPGTINIVGKGGALVLKGLESFVNDGTNNGGSGLLNIRNNSNITDFVNENSSTTTASAQLFFMNPGGDAKTLTYKFTDSTGVTKDVTTGDAGYSVFGQGSGYIRTLDIPNNTVPSGGVNLADGDTQDVFITTGAVQGNTALSGSPYSGSRFMVDVDEASRKADQLWVGDVVGGLVTIQPHFDGLSATKAAGYDPYGILVMSNVANPATDTSVLIDYTGSSWYAAPVDATDQGLYRAQIEYRQGAGAKSEDLSAFTGLGVASPTAAATGGYFLTFRPDTEFWQIASIGNAVQNLVRDARGNYLSRQTDMRDAVGDQALGTWVRISGSSTARDESYLEPNVTTQREITDRYWQSSTSVSVGADASTTTGYGKLAGGAFAGYVNSNVRFRAQTFGGLEQRHIIFPLNYVPSHQENRTAIDGYQVGGYASLIGDTYFIDGSLDYTSTDQNSFFTSLQNAQFGTDGKTWDASILAGTRFISDDVLSIEPLVGLEYMRTTQSGLNFGANVGATAVNFPKLESLRPGVGFRVRAASATDLYKLNLGLTGMWYHETKDSGSEVHGVSNGNGFTVSDYNGTNDFANVGIDANLFMANGLSTLISVNYRADFDDYQDLGLTTGIRYRW